MNQKPTTSAPATPAASSTDDELQRAINDIANGAISDDIFNKPSEPPMQPSAPTTPSTNPSLETSTPPFSFPTAQPFPASPSPLEFITTPINPEPNPIAAPMPPSIATPAQPLNTEKSTPEPENPISEPEKPELPTKPADHSELGQLKKRTLDQLIPVLDSLKSIDAHQKFKIYRGYIESGHTDIATLESASKAAGDITDESSRAEALLFIYNQLDK